MKSIEKAIKKLLKNIVKDYQKAEDLLQETFIYVMEHEIKKGCSFKCFVYLVAKSKSFNYLNVTNRRIAIENTYINKNIEVEKDILEILEKEETRKEVIEAIQLLDERYRNAIYLVNIEKLSYEETAQILSENIQNVKNLVHRGKKQLQKILIRKEFDNMNKSSKILLVIICVILLSGVAYGITAIVKKFTYNNITMNPTYESTLNKNTINNLWVGTLDLAWKDLEEKLEVSKIELEGDDIPQIANDLNSSSFSKDMLKKEDYEIKLERTMTNGYKIDATLNKDLHFLENFDNFQMYTTRTFGDSDEHIKYFGINNGTPEKVNKNVEVLFFNDNLQNDFAVNLKTQEGDEVILYRTDDIKNFDEYYDDIINKTEQYENGRELIEGEEIYIPYVRVKGLISYNELFGKEIKGTNGMYIDDVVQNVNFYLNEKGCTLSSKATMITEYNSLGLRTFDFSDTFIIFLKEKNAKMPYFALKVDNTDILEKIDENKKLLLLYDETTLENFDYSKLEKGEYKFFEDDNYEYYYPVNKTEYVTILCEEGEMTLEKALKENIVQTDILDEYEIEYIKKKK